MAAHKPKLQKYPLHPRTHTLSQPDELTLEHLRQYASDALGWTVGNSAVVRALIRYASQQPPEWAATALHPLIEQEIAGGTFWGSRKR